MIVYIWLAVLVVVAWLYNGQKKCRFTSYGVKNLATSFWRKEHFADQADRVYKAFPGERFIGRYVFGNPIVMLKDIELIKKVTVKDFEHFTDHTSIVTDKTDPLFGRTLITLKGQEWKDMRSTLSPAFTSSKIRLMLPFMEEVGKQMKESLQRKIKKSNNDYIDIDAKDLCSRYASDVIASCAFGLNVDSHKDENNQFYKMGKEAVNFGGIVLFLKLLFLNIMPKLMEMLKVCIFTDGMKNFFRHLVISAMKEREARNIIRHDMIHQLMEAKKGKLVHEDKGKDADAGFATVEESAIGKKNISRDWSDDHLIAQAIIFFIAGFETVSAGMSFTLHELAMNPDVQEKLAQEIRETNDRNDGMFDYNSVQNMTYLDMVISEVLRLWTPGPLLERVCVKEYNLGKASNDPAAKDYIMRVGEMVTMSIYSMHRDPAYFSDPMKFDPERFSNENKHKIESFTYMPFGIGPRNCIGSRFALCEMKVMLYQLLLHMKVEPNEKTCIPARLDPKSLNYALEGGHWLRFKMRN